MAIANGTSQLPSGWACNSGFWRSALDRRSLALAVWGTGVDPQFMQVFARHIKHKTAAGH